MAAPQFFAHGIRRVAHALSIAGLALAAAGCAAGGDELDTPSGPADPFVGHEEDADFVVDPSPDGKEDSISPETFNKNLVMTEAYYLDTESVSADELQRFFEETPYGRRSWLADERLNGERVADAIVKAAKEIGINPMVFVVRMQAEMGLVSRTSRPTGKRLNYAFGCGCPDNRACNPAYKGFGNQVRCAGKTLDKLYRRSADGTGQWQAGKATRTLDPSWVTPENHCTAAVYAYTPWVGRGRSGNWLLWNITRKFALHAIKLGMTPPIEEEPWVGTTCEDDAKCRFTGGSENGFCYRFTDEQGDEQGFCALRCAGTCPDRSGRAQTFCVADPQASGGMCVSKASESRNNNCGDIPGTAGETADRFIGTSSASNKKAFVCAPPGVE